LLLPTRTGTRISEALPKFLPLVRKLGLPNGFESYDSELRNQAQDHRDQYQNKESMLCGFGKYERMKSAQQKSPNHR